MGIIGAWALMPMITWRKRGLLNMASVEELVTMVEEEKSLTHEMDSFGITVKEQV